MDDGFDKREDRRLDLYEKSFQVRWVFALNRQGNKIGFAAHGVDGFEQVGEHVRIYFRDDRPDVWIQSTAERMSDSLGLTVDRLPTKDDELTAQQLDVISNAYGWQLEDDNHGQIVIYTGWRLGKDGELEEFKPESKEDDDGTD